MIPYDWLNEHPWKEERSCCFGVHHAVVFGSHINSRSQRSWLTKSPCEHVAGSACRARIVSCRCTSRTPWILWFETTTMTATIRASRLGEDGSDVLWTPGMLDGWKYCRSSDAIWSSKVFRLFLRSFVWVAVAGFVQTKPPNLCGHCLVASSMQHEPISGWTERNFSNTMGIYGLCTMVYCSASEKIHEKPAFFPIDSIDGGFLSYAGSPVHHPFVGFSMKETNGALPFLGVSPMTGMTIQVWNELREGWEVFWYEAWQVIRGFRLFGGWDRSKLWSSYHHNNHIILLIYHYNTI